jgi:hypothetical protein
MKFKFQLIFLFLPFILISQPEQIYSVYLIGDAGEDTISGKALLLLKEQLEADPESAVVFLGDNVYPDGFIINERKSEAGIESQLNILKDYKGSAYFIPGNHDWDAQKRRGLKKITDQKDYVESYLKKNSQIKNKEDKIFLPGKGLPGPETLMLNEKLRLILIDTQWFLHFYKKNKIDSKKNTEKIFYRKLDSLLQHSKLNKENVIVAGHHPMYTNGSHSRKLQPWRFMVNCTPFQVCGLLGLNRLFSQDLAQPKYRKMRKSMLLIFNKYDNITYTSGHDHNLQFFKVAGNKYIVSGSGSKAGHLQRKKLFDSFFQDDSKTGFVKLQYFPGKIITTIYRVGEEPMVLTGY